MHEYPASSPRARKCLSLGGMQWHKARGHSTRLFYWRVLGKSSDVAGANRLEADLPEVNLPLRDFVGNERSARMADRHLPGALNFAEGLTALHGIEAEPECR